jgi:hypothetical protein
MAVQKVAWKAEHSADYLGWRMAVLKAGQKVAWLVEEKVE